MASRIRRDSPRNYLPSSLKILCGLDMLSCPSAALRLARCAPFQFQILSICAEQKSCGSDSVPSVGSLSFTTTSPCPGSQSKVGLGRVVLLECAWPEVNRSKALSFIGGQSALKVGFGGWQRATAFGMDVLQPHNIQRNVRGRICTQ
jgi:hypothetical protein